MDGIMKVVRDRIAEIMVALIITLIIVAASFYVTTQITLDRLTNKSINTEKCIKSIETDVDDLTIRMNEKDVQYKEIVIRQEYMIEMLESLRGKK